MWFDLGSDASLVVEVVTVRVVTLLLLSQVESGVRLGSNTVTLIILQE